jgi:hypothetical protein
MSEQFRLRFESEAAATSAAAGLSALRVNGEEAMFVERRDRNVFAGCKIFSQVEPSAMLEGGPNGTFVGFFRIFYQVESLKSGMHHPDGILWMAIPGMKPSTHHTKVSLRNVAPTLLAMFGIGKPTYMTGKVLPAAAKSVAAA